LAGSVGFTCLLGSRFQAAARTKRASAAKETRRDAKEPNFATAPRVCWDILLDRPNASLGNDRIVPPVPPAPARCRAKFYRPPSLNSNPNLDP
jgi:hypothetical protein